MLMHKSEKNPTAVSKKMVTRTILACSNAAIFRFLGSTLNDQNRNELCTCINIVIIVTRVPECLNFSVCKSKLDIAKSNLHSGPNRTTTVWQLLHVLCACTICHLRADLMKL